MQKEKSVKSYTRRTKSGKTVVVHAYKAKYDAAEEMRKALAKKEGAGKELANRKKQVEQPIPDNKLGFSAEEFKAWYHWDMVDDPKNKAALKVEKALKKSMGVKAYNKFLDDMTDGYSARGHNKAFKGLESSLGTSKSKPTSKTASKTTASPVDEEVFLKKYDSKEKAAIKKGIREARTSGKTLYITKDSDNQLSIGENTYGDNVVGTIHPNGKLYRGEVTSKSVTPITKDKTPATHVTDEDGRKHSTKRNSLGISPAEWAAYNSGGVGIKGMSDKEVKAAIKHVESTLKKNLGSKVKAFKEYLDDSAQDGGDFKTDMKKLQGIMSAKDKTPKKREVVERKKPTKADGTQGLRRGVKDKTASSMEGYHSLLDGATVFRAGEKVKPKFSKDKETGGLVFKSRHAVLTDIYKNFRGNGWKRIEGTRLLGDDSYTDGKVRVDIHYPVEGTSWVKVRKLKEGDKV